MGPDMQVRAFRERIGRPDAASCRQSVHKSCPLCVFARADGRSQVPWISPCTGFLDQDQYPNAPKSLLEVSKLARRQSAGPRVERHREVFANLNEFKREAALAEAESEKPYNCRNLFTWVSNEEWPMECPACNFKAFLAGIQTGEGVVNTQLDDYAVLETVEKEHSAEKFKFPVCKLAFCGTEELEYAGIDINHTLRSSGRWSSNPTTATADLHVGWCSQAFHRNHLHIRRAAHVHTYT